MNDLAVLDLVVSGFGHLTSVTTRLVGGIHRKRQDKLVFAVWIRTFDGTSVLLEVLCPPMIIGLQAFHALMLHPVAFDAHNVR